MDVRDPQYPAEQRRQRGRRRGRHQQLQQLEDLVDPRLRDLAQVRALEGDRAGMGQARWNRVGVRGGHGREEQPGAGRRRLPRDEIRHARRELVQRLLDAAAAVQDLARLPVCRR
ncbi:MAG TPA: hypothetical protein VNL16_19115 [Chloroflexota bacterium]|nr:hypothetical protein [Chloroflexota bacterium]